MLGWTWWLRPQVQWEGRQPSPHPLREESRFPHRESLLGSEEAGLQAFPGKHPQWGHLEAPGVGTEVKGPVTLLVFMIPDSWA